MKHSGSIFIFGVLLAFLSVPIHKASAETNVNISNNGEGASSNVDVHTNTGGNTICVNGKCTTTNANNGKSTVCINGKCQSSDGSIHAESQDGKTKVRIDNSSKQEVEINNSSQSTKSAEELKKEMKAKLEKLKKNIKTPSAGSGQAKKFDIRELVRSELAFLRDLATFKFLFGNK